MNPYDQIKTPQGRLPIASAHVASEKGELRFEAEPPVRLAIGEANFDSCSIEELSVVSDVSSLERFAQKSGPLFGANVRESIFDWQSAVAMARAVVVLQEVVNGVKPLASAESFMVKTGVSSSRAGCDFVIYLISFDMGRIGDESRYRLLMPSMPQFKKFMRRNCFDYAFFQMEQEDENLIFSASLISFEREISLRDFSAVASYFEGVPESVFFEGFFGGDGPLEKDDFHVLAFNEADLAIQDAHIEESDLPHMQNFVHALISLHFQGIAIDMFRSSESDDFLIFNAYLSYLWYGFSRKLGQVQIGYCEQCGKGFSLTGHRGIRRRFCSESCKTKAKNERSRRLRDEVRGRFASGESVGVLASEIYGDESKANAEKHVISQLRGWKTLQREIDAALIVPGYKREILKRCVEEGIFSLKEIEHRMRNLEESAHLAKQARHHAETAGGELDNK